MCLCFVRGGGASGGVRWIGGGRMRAGLCWLVRWTPSFSIDNGTRHKPYIKRATHLESRPSINSVNFPNPNPPSLGCPRSFTPQVLMTSIQLRTRSSSLRVTKSKKLRPMHVVVASKLSFEQYMTVQLTEKRSRMSAVRKDCSGRGSNVIGSTRSRARSRS